MIHLSNEIVAAIDAGRRLAVASAQRAAALRLADAVRRLGRGWGAWRSPAVNSLWHWIEREHDLAVREQPLLRPLLAPEHEWLLWQRAAEQLAPERLLLAPAALADRLQHAAQLAADWAISGRRIAADPGREAACLHEAMTRVERDAREFGAIPRHRLYAERRAAGLESAAAAPGEAPPPLLCGLEPLPPGLRGWLEEAGWIAGASAAATPSGAATDSQRDPGAGPVAGSTAATAHVHAARDAESEYGAIAEWAAEALERDPRARLLVLVPELAGVRHRLERVLAQRLDPRAWSSDSADGVAYSVEGGRPLAQYREITLALDLLELLLRPLPILTLERVLLDYDGFGVAVTLRARWCAALRAEGLARAEEQRSIDELLAMLTTLRSADPAAADRVVSALREAQRRLSARREPMHTRVTEFGAALARLGWMSGAPLDSARHQLRQSWTELLAACARVSAAIGECSAIEGLLHLRALAERRGFAPASGDVPVTLSADLSDPVVGYDAIWVCGLRADTWPRPASPDPFVPWYLQREAGVPQATAAGCLELARRQLAAWRSRTRELTLSWPLFEHDARLVPSPLLAAFPARPAEARAHVGLHARLAAAGAAPCESRLDVTGLPWPAERPMRGGAQPLDLQNQCPFRAYAETRLGARAEREVEPGIGGRDRGSLLHAVLERLWERLGGHDALCAHDEAALTGLARAVIDAVFDAIPLGADDPLRERQLRRERRRTLSVALELLRYERQRAPFAVVARERSARLEAGGLRLQLKLDRVDRLDDGSLMVLDYKSGRGTKADWDGARAEPVQLLVYETALAAEGEVAVAALALARLAPGETRYELRAGRPGLVPRGKADQHWAERIARGREHVAALAAALQRGDARVDPKHEACDWCALTPLCRRTVRALDEAAASDEGSDSRAAAREEGRVEAER